MFLLCLSLRAVSFSRTQGRHARAVRGGVERGGAWDLCGPQRRVPSEPPGVGGDGPGASPGEALRRELHDPPEHGRAAAVRRVRPGEL